MFDTPTARPTEPTEAERKMRTLAYNWCARHRLQVLERDVNALVRSLLDAARPEPRPVDDLQPRVPRGAVERTAAIRALLPEPAPKPPRVAPPPRPVPSVAERVGAEGVEALRLIADDASNGLIAHKLGVSEHRVKYLVGRLKQLLGESDRSQLARAGVVAGLLPEPVGPVVVPEPVSCRPVADQLGLDAEAVAVVLLVAEGLVNARIAEATGLTKYRVERVVFRLHAALGTSDRPGLVAEARSVGLVPGGVRGEFLESGAGRSGHTWPAVTPHGGSGRLSVAVRGFSRHGASTGRREPLRAFGPQAAVQAPGQVQP